MNIVDILFHIHPDLSEEQRSNIEDSISAQNGVMHVNFNDKVSHELSVSYDPDAITADSILAELREWDTNATMVGL